MALTEEQKAAALEKLEKKKGQTPNKYDKANQITDPIKETAPNKCHYSYGNYREQIEVYGKNYSEAEAELKTWPKYRDTINLSATETEVTITTENDSKQSTKDKLLNPFGKSSDTTTASSNTSASSSGTSSATAISNTNYDKEQAAKLAKEHPERVVNGIYYSTDALANEARKKLEEQTKKAKEAAKAAAKAKADSVATALKNINQVLYGQDYEQVLEQLQGQVGGIDLTSVLGDGLNVRARQKLLNMNDYIDEYKEPNSGKH